MSAWAELPAITDDGPLCLTPMPAMLGRTMKKVAKRILDRIAAGAKRLEEIVDRHATVLPGFERSLQLDCYTCGAQSAYMILRYYGKARSITHVTRELGTTEEGTSQPQLRTLFTKRGLLAKRINRPTLGKLRDAIERGCPLLVSLDDGGHWGVVYGYSQGSIYVADPSWYAILCRHRTRRFLERWDRWAMIVTKQTKQRTGKTRDKRAKL
jgi:ABC-type bacteriocin/lantibiotic exporter with double-glycine peptidase domain